MKNAAKSRMSAGHSKSSAIEINSSENISRFHPVTTDRHEATVGFAVWIITSKINDLQ
jgi:hypothetical protein